MRVRYSKGADLAYIYLRYPLPQGSVVKTYGCDPNEVGEINLDFDESGHLVGIEVLDASRKLPPSILEDATIID